MNMAMEKWMQDLKLLILFIHQSYCGNNSARLQCLLGHLLGEILALTLLAICVNRVCKLFWTPKLPPGPRGWPVFGSLFDARKLLSTNMQDLTKRYGPMVSLRLGSVPVIVIADAELAREAFIAKGSIFASRPTLPSSVIFTCGYRTVTSGQYGQVWRALRRNLVTGLIKASETSSDLKHVRERVMQDLERRLSDASSQNGGKIEVRAFVRHCLFDLLLTLCFGKQVDEDVHLRVAETQRNVLLRSRSRVDDFIPWLAFLSWMQKTKHQKIRQDEADALLPLIQDAKKAYEEGSLPADCYLVSLLSMELEGQRISDENITCLCSELLLAGGDTSSTAIEWALARIVDKPQIQANMLEEIESVLGKATVTEDDLCKLPYLEAVVMETLRRHPPAFSTIPHAVTKPCKLRGYEIPTNALIFLSLAGFSLDPHLWEDPLEFRPERFLGLDVDIRGSKNITMIPFGIGRRICPGLGLGLMHTRFILARLVQSFEWRIEAPGEKIDFTGTPEMTIVMRTPLRARIKPRQGKII